MRTLTDMTDEELAMSYVEGNNRAFDLLLTRNQYKLFSYILFVVHDRETAEDVFQETFVKVITKLHQNKYKPCGKFNAWLIRIAHNVIMDMYRLQKNDKTVEPTTNNDLSNLADGQMFESNIENEFVNQQVMSDVRKLMSYLPAPQREVVYMRYYQQMTFKEISQTTNVSINTVLGRMRYAMMNLRKMAKEHKMVLQLV